MNGDDVRARQELVKVLDARNAGPRQGGIVNVGVEYSKLEPEGRRSGGNGSSDVAESDHAELPPAQPADRAELSDPQPPFRTTSLPVTIFRHTASSRATV